MTPHTLKVSLTLPTPGFLPGLMYGGHSSLRATTQLKRRTSFLMIWNDWSKFSLKGLETVKFFWDILLEENNKIGFISEYV